MPDYIQFESPEGTVLVEVDEGEVSAQRGGIQKAGLGKMVSNTVAQAGTSLEQALQRAIRSNAQAFIASVVTLPILPSEAEFSFALNITGEAGNVAVGKLGGETNYTVRLTWKREPKETSQNGH